MDLVDDGAAHFSGLLASAEVDRLRAFFTADSASRRLVAGSGLAALIGPADVIAQALLPGARPAFARYFHKSREANWALAWHQDRTIALAAHRDTPGFTAWTVKQGIAHAVPPFEYLERMLILRVHLDDTGEHQAPLLVAPSSHCLGAIAETEIPAAVAGCGTHACLAASGDVWAYAAPILHASTAIHAPGHRRVLQLAYSADPLPGGLEWLGV
ncbi:MAG TPA: phytanoyl-CoA dioxygenase [Allosphingosinicella sp.]|nr:phytanoyl-CoA dioxygenase [Allosphingosinicella sp.]